MPEGSASFRSAVIPGALHCPDDNSFIEVMAESVADGLVIGRCIECRKSFSNVKPEKVDGNWVFRKTKGMHEMRPI